MKHIESFKSTITWDSLGLPSVNVDACFEGGRVISKAISFEDYEKLLFGSKKEKTTYFSLEQPKGFYSGYGSIQKGTFKVILYVPAGKHQFVSTKMQIAEQLFYPALLFKIEYVDGRCVKKDCFALKSESEPCEDTELYCYPYGNVSSDGNICMGNIEVKIDNISQAYKFVDAFFEGIDEGHYYSPGNTVKPKLKQEVLVRKVLNKKCFPNEWLMPANRKVKDILFKV